MDVGELSDKIRKNIDIKLNFNDTIRKVGMIEAKIIKIKFYLPEGGLFYGN